MTTAVAAAPVLAPSAEHSVAHARAYATIAPSSAFASATPSRAVANSDSAHRTSPPSLSRSSSDGKRSPTSQRNGNLPPKISIKKEPASPELPTSKHRPCKLDLSSNMSNGASRPPAPLTARDSAGLAIQDMGLACLSPGFHTQDPTMRVHLQRSIDVREQQRQLIEARQKGGRPPSDGEGSRHIDSGLKTAGKPPGSSRRKGPPPGLSINAPSHSQFANERVIQSAPLNQSFTGLRNHNIQPMTRQVANQPASLSQTSHIHHVPANQTNNRLPPISDVFGSETLNGPQSSRPRFFNDSPGHSSHSNIQPPLPSPGFSQAAPPTGRPREYKSAEEAVQSMSGGREDLLPRIVHYGGHQPPTPPSPMPKHNRDANGLGVSVPTPEVHRSGSGRRRGRDEYERDMGSPPLGRGSDRRAAGPFGEGRDSPDTNRRKKDEFIQLCARAWDLFHS